MSVTVRRAVPGDAPKIAEYALKLVDQHVGYDPRRFSRIAAAEEMERFYGGRTQVEDAAILLAEIDGNVAGFAYLQFEELSYADLLRKAVWLHDIYIDESDRGHGAGKALMSEAIEAARELGGDRLMLSVAAKNGFAQAFFAETGFKVTMVEMMFDLNDR